VTTKRRDIIVQQIDNSRSKPLLANRVAVVTGGSSGNGRSIALAFARYGARAVVIADIREEPREGGEPTHSLIKRTLGVESRFVECDMSKIHDVERAIGATDSLGGVDVLVNNAAIYRYERFMGVEESDFNQMMDINVKGAYFASQFAARRMESKGCGCIINISSTAGLRGSAGRSTYCISKGAIQAMTYVLAAELGPLGIRVNTIMPGLVRTAMTTVDIPVLGTNKEDDVVGTIPLQRPGEPEDVANTAVYLASDLASYVSATSLLVDGGDFNAMYLPTPHHGDIVG
jgi:NAD(P)-dependent dehydrogenase (short-subunit alcohol dehydrogenase family)